MTVTELTSRENPLLRRIRLVAARARKAPANLVLAEGVRSVEEAACAGRDIEAALYTEEFGASKRGAPLLRALSEQRVHLYRIQERLLRSVSDVQSPQGILALVRVPLISYSDWPPPRAPLILCVCGLQDPGNLGTLIRSAAAAGASLVCATPGTVSPRTPKVIRASAGSFFHLPVIECLNLTAFLADCHDHSIATYRTDAHGESLYTEVDYTSGIALLLGNEGRGVADAIPPETGSIRIPMAPGVESLNVGVAGALLLYEAFRQRAAQPPRKR
jgi:RNA methyltransferase, TrmH family